MIWVCHNKLQKVDQRVSSLKDVRSERWPRRMKVEQMHLNRKGRNRGKKDGQQNKKMNDQWDKHLKVESWREKDRHQSSLSETKHWSPIRWELTPYNEREKEELQDHFTKCRKGPCIEYKTRMIPNITLRIGERDHIDEHKNDPHNQAQTDQYCSHWRKRREIVKSGTDWYRNSWRYERGGQRRGTTAEVWTPEKKAKGECGMWGLPA